MDYEIFSILTNKMRLASLHDLQTKYNTNDLFDLLEVMEAMGELQDIANLQSEQNQQR